MDKLCSMCKQILPIDMFNKDRGMKSGYHSSCRKCHRILTKRWQVNNPEKVKANKKRSNQRHPESFKRRKKRHYDKCTEFLYMVKKEHGCMICQEGDVDCLDFHHINPNEKDFWIASKKGIGYKILLRELSKCCIVCANCHRKIHVNKIPSPSKTIDVTKYIYLTRDGKLD